MFELKTTSRRTNRPTSSFAIDHKQGREPLLGYLTKGIFCCISEGVSDMRLGNLSSRAGTIDIPKIP